jgi:hypothetical protein
MLIRLLGTMKRNLLLTIILLLSKGLFAQTQQKGYSIGVSLKPFKNTFVYLGYYYGPKKGLTDSVKLDANGKGVIAGKEPLPGGIYFLVSPHKEIL